MHALAHSDCAGMTLTQKRNIYDEVSQRGKSILTTQRSNLLFLICQGSDHQLDRSGIFVHAWLPKSYILTRKTSKRNLHFNI